MSLSPVIASRAAGLLVGLSLVGIVAAQSWRVPASARSAQVGVDLRAVPSGEVGVAPAGALLDPPSLAAGGPAARGSVRLTNRTAGPIVVRPRVTGGDAVLDRSVMVELTVDGRVAHRGWLPGLGDATIALAQGGSARIGLSARVPGSAASEAAARSGRWTIAFTERP